MSDPDIKLQVLLQYLIEEKFSFKGNSILENNFIQIIYLLEDFLSINFDLVLNNTNIGVKAIEKLLQKALISN